MLIPYTIHMYMCAYHIHAHTHTCTYCTRVRVHSHTQPGTRRWPAHLHWAGSVSSGAGALDPPACSPGSGQAGRFLPHRIQWGHSHSLLVLTCVPPGGSGASLNPRWLHPGGPARAEALLCLGSNKAGIVGVRLGKGCQRAEVKGVSSQEIRGRSRRARTGGLASPPVLKGSGHSAPSPVKRKVGPKAFQVTILNLDTHSRAPYHTPIPRCHHRLVPTSRAWGHSDPPGRTSKIRPRCTLWGGDSPCDSSVEQC